MSTTAFLMVAAGRGMRAGGGTPKQYRPVKGEPMLCHTLRAALACDAVDWLQVVIGPGDHDLYEAAIARVEDGRLLPVITGGATRALSVRAGLEALADIAPQNVLIHDAARPFMPPWIVEHLIVGLSEADGAFPACPVVDALWTTDLTPVARNGLLRAQTPQAFRYDAIRAAHAAADPDAADDVAVALAAGMTVVDVAGDERNFKVTTPDDFARAETMTRRIPDIRTGTGFDVHAFEEGDHVILCGVKIPHSHALKGHSDADVALHTITDAIYGALAEGDIGTHFPPSEAQWKAADSAIFLEHAMGLCKTRGFVVSHIDATIICEMPKIGPHAVAMREQLSRITGLEMERLSVKATTTEKLGFPGRGEGIAALATVTLVRA